MIVLLFPVLLLFLLVRTVRDYIKKSKGSFSEYELLASFRLLLFMEVISPETWNIAYAARSNPLIYGKRNIPELEKALLSSFRRAQENGEISQIDLEKVEFELKYKCLGIMCEKSSDVVDKLLAELRSSGPAESMRIANALVIASQKNPYAVSQIIKVRTTPQEFPEAEIEYDIIGDALAPLNKSALIALLEEVSDVPLDRNVNSRQGVARFLLSNIIELEPEAEQYLEAVIYSGRFRKSVTALKVFQRLYGLRNLDMSDKMVDYCLYLINKPQFLYQDIDDIEFLEPIPRNLIIKMALKSILLAPNDIQGPLLQRLVDGIINWDISEIANDLVEMGASHEWANKVSISLLFGDEKEFEAMLLSLSNEIKNPAYKQVLRIIASNHENPPAFDFDEFRNAKHSTEKRIYLFADRLTKIYLAQILAPGIICTEIKDLEREINWYYIDHRIKNFVSCFGADYEVFQYGGNWPNSKGFFKVQKQLENARKHLYDNEPNMQTESQNNQMVDLFDRMTSSDDHILSRSAQEFLLKTEISNKTAEYILNILDAQENELSDTGDLGWKRSNLIKAIWNAPPAANPEAITYMLTRVHSPISKEKSGYTFLDEIGNLNIFWVNSFVSHSVLSSKHLTDDDINGLVKIAQNEFLSPDTKAGMLIAFSKIRDSMLAMAHLDDLYGFSQSKASSVAIAAFFSISQIIEKNKNILDESTLNRYIEHLEENIDGKNVKDVIRNIRELPMIFEIEASTIKELITVELYKAYLGRYVVGNLE